MCHKVCFWTPPGSQHLNSRERAQQEGDSSIVAIRKCITEQKLHCSLMTGITTPHLRHAPQPMLQDHQVQILVSLLLLAGLLLRHIPCPLRSVALSPPDYFQPSRCKEANTSVSSFQCPCAPTSAAAEVRGSMRMHDMHVGLHGQFHPLLSARCMCVCI